MTNVGQGTYKHKGLFISRTFFGTGFVTWAIHPSDDAWASPLATAKTLKKAKEKINKWQNKNM